MQEGDRPVPCLLGRRQVVALARGVVVERVLHPARDEALHRLARAFQRLGKGHARRVHARVVARLVPDASSSLPAPWAPRPDRAPVRTGIPPRPARRCAHRYAAHHGAAPAEADRSRPSVAVAQPLQPLERLHPCSHHRRIIDLADQVARGVRVSRRAALRGQGIGYHHEEPASATRRSTSSMWASGSRFSWIIVTTLSLRSGVSGTAK